MKVQSKTELLKLIVGLLNLVGFPFRTSPKREEKNRTINNPYLRISNRAQYWTNKISVCVDEGDIEASKTLPDIEFMKECAGRAKRYLRHIKRLGRLSLQIENQELKKTK